MMFAIKNLDKFSNSKELMKLIKINEISIDEVYFSDLKLNNDGYASLIFTFNNQNGALDFLPKDVVEISFNAFCDEMEIKYASFQELPIHAIFDEGMAVIEQKSKAGISIALKYSMRPTLKFKVIRL